MVCFHINKIFSHIQKRIRLYIQKNPRQIATANSQICNTEDGVEYSVWESFTVKIKRKQVTKLKLWGLISLISKTNISNISEISFSWKWLTPIVFAVSIIQLPSRKGARYGFNVPNCYLKTKAKYEQDKKYFTD